MQKSGTAGRVEYLELPGVAGKVPTVRAGAGVVTRQVSIWLPIMDWYLPWITSQDASTIGGNIAMNAGGKKRYSGAPRWITWHPGVW